MSHLGEQEVTFESIATLCEENQDELADLILQEVPFYSFIKTEATDEFDSAHGAQMVSFVPCDMVVTDITDIAHEETCSSDCYNIGMVRSPDSVGSMLHLSPDHRKKCDSNRKNRTPNTLRNMMEKHRHSERKRHHSLNERLKAICQVVPGSSQDSRETKVVMMQRVISYIAYLENSIKLLCNQIGTRPHSSWVLLTSNFSSYFRDYFKGIDDLDTGDDEITAATKNLSESMKAEDRESYKTPHPKVSSPTVDSTTDSVVPVMVPQVEKEVVVLSQDSGVPSSSLGGEDDLSAQLWTVSSGYQNVVAVSNTHGNGEVFFSSSTDDGVSAVLEISSSTNEKDTVTIEFGTDFGGDRTGIRTTPVDGTKLAVPKLLSVQQSPLLSQPVNSFYTIQKHVPEIIPRRNKRKQISPRRSAYQDDDLSEQAYLSSWPAAAQNSTVVQPEREQSPHKVRVLPYNIRCNHRHPVQRLQTFASKSGTEQPPVLTVVRPSPQPPRVVSPKTQGKVNTKLDLRKTSWMNGFMMFSRLNRRSFIQTHPGVHTSHISKLMGHAWRNMTAEEQAPYKEKAKVCAKELYRVYTSQPEFKMYSSTSDTDVTASDNSSVPSLTDKSVAINVE